MSRSSLAAPLLRAFERVVEPDPETELPTDQCFPFGLMFDDLPDPTVVIDRDGLILWANRAWRTVWKRSLHDAIGQSIADTVGGETQRRAAGGRVEMLRRLSPDNREMEQTFRIREDLVVSVVYRAWFDAHDELVAITAVSHDCTASERYESRLRHANRKLAESNRDLRDFAHIASHDLQEPMRKITTFTDRLVDRAGADLDERSRDYLARIHSAAVRMQSLITSVLELSRVSTQGSDFTRVDLDEAVGIALGDLELRVRESDAIIESDPLPTVDGDLYQLAQLFQNLLSNALKFVHQDRRPHVRIAVDVDGDEHRIRVCDNGVGFDSDSADRVFAPFQRLHGRSEYEGSGIGLAVCRRIVERHHGWIGAAAVPGEGATVTVRLPIDDRYRMEDGDSP